jgi:hypothetical protein
LVLLVFQSSSRVAASGRTLAVLAQLVVAAASDGAGIDRQALVSRHDVVLTKLDPEAPLSLGNGEFAFTADVTGLQTFAESYDAMIPLGTLSNWGWHTWPNPNGWTIEKFHWNEFTSHGRRVGYADIPGDSRTPEIEWLRANPHRLHLGRIGFRLTKADGSEAKAADLQDVEQRLELWNGVLKSRFRLEGRLVEVETLVDPERDVLAVRVVSPLLGEGRLAVRFRFPYGTGATTAADWTKPDAHATSLTPLSPNAARFARRLDDDSYVVDADWAPGGTVARVAAHDYVIEPPRDASALSLLVSFAPRESPARARPTFEEVRARTRAHWNGFWRSGGAIDLSESKDPRWRELERRIVLSQYLTAIQGSGSLPPQETGLTFNSWEGKFHLEMHYWHAAQFALWGRLPLLEKSLDYYQRILPRAKETARRQGYRGARWPKMTGPTGAESPSSVGPFLVWQQPHPIYYAELVHRERPGRATLERFKDVVFESAEFMASFTSWERDAARHVLGPTLQCAQVVFPKDRTVNCTYELVYWRWGLEAAQAWRERLGMPRETLWDGVLGALARPALADGKYLFAESAPESYTDPRWARDHPAVTAALGVLPGPGIDKEAMRRTLDWVLAKWDWPSTWGWDYPMVAMTAARLGETRKAVDALLLDTPKNRYRANGHNHQRPGLTIYLPGNGALLLAAAMMAGGWDGGPARSAPGFPDDGSWSVRHEGLRRMP